ncbi:MAG: hypothetical protein RX317_07040 [bacterium]|nr:hypothetical protein [bacterium]
MLSVADNHVIPAQRSRLRRRAGARHGINVLKDWSKAVVLERFNVILGSIVGYWSSVE